MELPVNSPASDAVTSGDIKNYLPMIKTMFLFTIIIIQRIRKERIPAYL